MKSCDIVIGSLFGDEGKGHMTEILTTKEACINVRFNGGAQAAHTAFSKDGKRHAFRHFGSGTFNGAVTYLAAGFMVNIFQFFCEKKQLEEEFGITPLVFVNPKCRVTTMVDVKINQMMEKIRGNAKHGTCGMGINETACRCKEEEYSIFVLDLLNEEELLKKLYRIQNEYVQKRLKAELGLSIEDLPRGQKELLLDRVDIDMFLFYAREFLKSVQIVEDSVLLRYDRAVFEGAQGLLLDQNYLSGWPYITTSNTGIKNAMRILDDIGYTEDTSIYYMSRCYATRHGAGPLPFESKGKIYSKIEDLTNLPNEYQGSLRFGLLNTDMVTSAINHDLESLNRSAKVNITLTCFDQLDDSASFIDCGKKVSVGTEDFLQSVKEVLKRKVTTIDGVFATCSEKSTELKKV